MEKSVSGPIVKCMSCGVWVHLENFSYLWKHPGCFAKCKTFFFYNTWAKFLDPNNLRKITWLFHLHIRLKWVQMDAKFERALKSLNFTDDCMAHPIGEQYLRWLFYLLIGLYQNLIKPLKGLLHNLYATHKHLLWRNIQRETCRRLGIETTG